MSQYLIFLLLGLANGAVYAALALALVVTYRSSGVVNFGTGAMALFTAYTYAFLRQGRFLILIPGLPGSFKLGFVMGFWPAMICSLLISALLGLILYALVFRPLRTAPAVARAVASIGVMVVLTGVMSQRIGTNPVSAASILPSGTWRIGSVHVPADHVWFALTVIIIASALAAAFRYTRFGLITRAAAETEKGAYVSGIAPDRLAAINWMISAAVGGLSGILIAPILPLVPESYTLFIVPALAAAIIGRFQYILPAVGAGLVIGMLESETTYLQGQHSWLPQAGLSDLVPLILILLVLVVRARPLPSRGALIQQTLGTAPRPKRILAPAAVGTVVGIGALAVLQQTWRASLLTSLIFGVIALSLVVVTGYAGQISLVQLTLAGVGGFLLGPLTQSWHIPFTDVLYPFPVAPILAGLGAMVIGVVVGLPALRIRGLPVAVVTLSLGVVLENMWFNNSQLVGVSGKNVSGPTIFGLDLQSRVGVSYPRLSFCILVLLILVGTAVGVAKLRNSRLGSEMLAVRANERSAAGSGVDVVRVKLIAFAIGSFIAGMGGCLIGYQQQNVTFDSFDVLVGLGVFGSVYLAGITSVSGGILAGIIASNGLVFLAAQKWLSLGDWFDVITGVGLILTVVLNPEGLVGPIHSALGARRRGATSSAATLTLAAPPDRQEARPPHQQGPVILSVADIKVAYGGMVAVNCVTLDVHEGDIVGLIGPNGAGKTTLLDAFTGFAPSKGTVELDGRSLDGLPPHRRVRAGLGRTFQQAELYEDLSVSENVIVGRAAGGGRQARSLEDVLTLLDLTSVAEVPVRDLSQGRRQLVSIARSLIGNPRVLLLDEPGGGLDSMESQWLGQRLLRIRDSGVTVFMIDHDMHLVLGVCDEIHVLNFGSLIASGPPDAIKSNRAVADAYLGSTHAVEVEA